MVEFRWDPRCVTLSLPRSSVYSPVSITTRLVHTERVTGFNQRNIDRPLFEEIGVMGTDSYISTVLYTAPYRILYWLGLLWSETTDPAQLPCTGSNLIAHVS